MRMVRRRCLTWIIDVSLGVRMECDLGGLHRVRGGTGEVLQ